MIRQQYLKPTVSYKDITSLLSRQSRMSMKCYRIKTKLVIFGVLLLCMGCEESISQQDRKDDLIPATAKRQFDSVPAHRYLPQNVPVPPGMVFVPGGYVDLGSDLGFASESPISHHAVNGFFMDEHPVTVAQFRAFVVATGYKTESEIFGDAGVFLFRPGKWDLVKGANWQHPFGPTRPAAPDDHPVTQVSWNDAQAYAAWAGKRLPREMEWEHAARNGNNSRSRYPWGEDIREGKSYLANFWQGNFPHHDTGQDGFKGTSPVGYFGKTSLGLTDMAGNVWEWCEDWFEPYDASSPSLRQRPDEPERVMRGGSFLCDPRVCHGFRVSGRAGTTPETGLCHLGFRCVKEIK